MGTPSIGRKSGAVTVAIMAGLLIIFVACAGDEGIGDGTTTNALSEEGGVTPDAQGQLIVIAGDNWFVSPGDQRAGRVKIVVEADKEFNLVMPNEGLSIHNLRFSGYDGKYNTDDDYVTEPAAVRGGQTGSFTFTLDEPGSFPFRCDFHAVEMEGAVVLR